MTKEKKTESPTGRTCEVLKNEIHVRLLKGKVTRLKSKLAINQEQWVDTFKTIQVRRSQSSEADLFLIIIHPAEPRHNNNNSNNNNMN